MESTLDLVRGVLTLDEDSYRDFLASNNVMRRGFLILLACYFLATIPVIGQTWLNLTQQFTPDTAAEVEQQIETMFDQFMPAGEASAAEMAIFKENFSKGMQIAVDIVNLPAPLPRSLSAALQALGDWVSAALSGIGPWLSYGAFVLLFAKLAGGRGILNEFYGLTALVAVPAVLRIFSFVPFVGPLLAFIALVWGVVIYVRAVQISQELSPGKAFLVAFLPALIVIGLLICFGAVGVGGLISAISAAQ
ncbi:MAG: hypothetical protein ACK2UK_15110 [Candidatus Promineifilaceae bacterium]